MISDPFWTPTSAGRRADGLLRGHEALSLLEMVERSPPGQSLQKLMGDMRAVHGASPSKMHNTLLALRDFGLVHLEKERVFTGSRWVDSAGRLESLGTLTADSVISRILTAGPLACLRYQAAEDALWLDSMCMPTAHDGLSRWVLDFKVATRENAGARLWRVAQPHKELFLGLARRANASYPKKRALSPSQLSAMLKRNAEDGDMAEDWVLMRELKRLQDHPLKHQIRRVSLEDVSAGYDIISFVDVNSIFHDLHIEVKSYSGRVRFCWSRNEVETARRVGESYSLYLVDRAQMDRSGYSPTVIRGPYSAMFQTGLPGWTVSIETYECVASPDKPSFSSE